jgi:hypothetical protein
MVTIVDLDECIYDFSLMFMEICQQADVEPNSSTIHLPIEAKEFVNAIDILFCILTDLRIDYNQIDISKDSNQIFLLYLTKAYLGQFSPRTYMVVNEKMYPSIDEQITDWIVFINSLIGGDQL